MTSYMQTSVAASSFLGGTGKWGAPHLLGALISHQMSGSLSVLHNNLAVPSAIQKTVFNPIKCVLKAEPRVLNRGDILVLLSYVFSRTGLNVDSVTCSLNSILCSGWNMVEESCTFMFRFMFPRIKPSGDTALWTLCLDRHLRRRSRELLELLLMLQGHDPRLF